MSSRGGETSETGTESEADALNRMVKDLTAVPWTPNVEGKLEDILIRAAFNFKKAARAFQRFMNDSSNPDSMQTVFYRIDAKTLQLKWTEIEVRKHVIPNMHQQNSGAGNGAEEEDEDEDGLEAYEPDGGHITNTGAQGSIKDQQSPEKAGAAQQSTYADLEEID